MPSLIIAKIGGKIVEDKPLLEQFLDDFSEINQLKLLVHGGGRSATDVAKSLGIHVQMVDGRRITDGEMLRVVTMVYGGLINKSIVSTLQGNGCNAIGLTGADANIIRAHKREVRDIDYGYVGDIDSVDIKPLIHFLSQGFTPVLAPLTHDQQGSILNTNADTIATAVAGALSAEYDVQLFSCFEKSGVLTSLRDEESVVPELSFEQYEKMKEAGRIEKGMLPKLDTGFQSLESGVKSVTICHAGALVRIVSGKTPDTGTRLKL